MPNSIKKMLIVDDSRLSRLMIRTFILAKRPQWLIIEATSGDEALQIVERDLPDFISMDINMPGMLGTDAAEQILDKHPEIRIAIFSANIQETQQTRAIELGARFVSKPVTEKTVLQALDHFEGAV
ncbi:MAG: response regulator [Gallionella sp.]|jgi:CheY-like chemotaxis protein|nr:response regulator [Gallionella sp.]OGS67114.1 MAG: response regulator receiver protein [Gallionellales bacterium GWA2_54_124]